MHEPPFVLELICSLTMSFQSPVKRIYLGCIRMEEEITIAVVNRNTKLCSVFVSGLPGFTFISSSVHIEACTVAGLDLTWCPRLSDHCSAQKCQEEELWLLWSPAEHSHHRHRRGMRISSRSHSFFWEQHMVIISLNASHHLTLQTVVILTDFIHAKKKSEAHELLLPHPSRLCPSAASSDFHRAFTATCLLPFSVPLMLFTRLTPLIVQYVTLAGLDG